MAKVVFKIGEAAQLAGLEKKDGQFIVVKDEHSIYVDAGEERIRIGDFQVVEAIKDLPAEGASETALYYVSGINALAKWDPKGGDLQNGAWVQINPDTGATQVKVAGGGAEAVTASYDGATRTITITVPDKLVTETALGEKIGDLNGKESVVAYVDDKTKDIATNEKITEIEGKVDALTEKVGETSVEAQITEALSPLDTKYAQKTHEHTTSQITDFATEMAKKADATELETLQGEVDTLNSSIAGLSGAMHFKGKADEDPSSMEDTSSYKSGDVVTWENKEYVFIEGQDAAPGKFEEFGDTSLLSQKVTSLESWKSTTQETIESLGTTYETKGAAEAVKTELIGEEQDTDASDTIKGAKKYADKVVTDLGIGDYLKTAELPEQLTDYVKTEALDAYVSDAELPEKLADYAKVADLEWQSF